MLVPFLDLITPHRELEEELVSVFRKALSCAGFIGGPMVEEFEREFAALCGSAYCIGVNSGTDALRFALTGAGVKPGDTVITVPNTFIATTEAISQAGARMAFVDVDERTCTIDVGKLREFIEISCALEEDTGRLMHMASKSPVTAVIPVHLYGQMADMDGIQELAETYRLKVIEDACQAHGAEYFSDVQKRWLKAGTVGHAAAFSFYPGKNLGACGEAGAITTDDHDLAATARMLRDHGQSKKYYHDIEGYNGRLDAIQAGLLTAKLAHLGGWNELRRVCARRYDHLLSDVDEIEVPYEAPYSKSVYHLYVVRTDDREGLQKYLGDNGVSTGLHYPVPLHLQKAYAHLGFRQGDFPVSERLAKRILSLPMYPGLTEAQQEYVVEKIKEWKKQNPESRIQ
jgi:dTDP-4-amino-4,6-dideoxygalactose transaminase